jgi:hypothetical protein
MTKKYGQNSGERPKTNLFQLISSTGRRFRGNNAGLFNQAQNGRFGGLGRQ